ncbi:MAG TPA: MBOAT family O-acyltransferase [Lachnospiraceae bacterium]|nr:MBOAT family O-acyltransferase [Lachnospiraceae bacterium]
MVFNSVDFLVFFPVVLLIYFFIPKRIRYIWLLIASYYFYTSWDVKYVGCLLFSTLVTYFAGLLIGRYRHAEKYDTSVQGGQKETLLFIICLLLNFSMLFIFKYTNFMLDNIADLAGLLKITFKEPDIELLLPVGISFFTFQSAGYLIDVYKGEINPEKNLLKYALFVSFFPNILSGPIERAKNMLPQIENCKQMKLWNYERITEGAVYMLWGYFLKMVIADRSALLVNTVYGNYRMYGSVALITATFFFAVQIYCDFASYSYLALGAAKILGFSIMNNFNAPYFSKSIGEFWRRWHISLSSWLRDYLYIPLGGNRRGRFRKHLNTIIVFFVSGVWHGANWGYVVWGLLHGVYIVIGDLLRPYKKRAANTFHIKTQSFSYRLLQTGITFLLVCFSWIFFKTEQLSAAVEVIRRMFVKWDPWTIFDGTIYTWGLSEKDFRITVFTILLLLAADLIKKKKGGNVIGFLNQQNIWFRWGIYIFICCAIAVWGQYGAGHDPQAFLYFSF